MYKLKRLFLPLVRLYVQKQKIIIIAGFNCRVANMRLHPRLLFMWAVQGCLRKTQKENLHVPDCGFCFQLIFVKGHGFFRVSSLLEQGLIHSYFLLMLCRSLINSAYQPHKRPKPRVCCKRATVGSWGFVTIWGICSFLAWLSGAPALLQWWFYLS